MKNHLENPSRWTMKFCLAALGLAPGLVSAALVHQYTFEDGTSNDGIGGLNGTLNGTASVSGGQLSLDGSGTMDLDGTTLDLAGFSNLTIEAWATPDSGMGGFHTLFAAGNVNTVSGDWLANYVLLQTHRGDDASRAAVQVGDVNQPWTAEEGVNGPELNDDALHLYTMTVADIGTVNETLTFYVDGVIQGSPLVLSTTSVANTGTEVASIGSGYPADPFWVGSVEEFNIHDMALDATTVVNRFNAGPVPEPSVALLGGLGILGLLRRRRNS